MSERHIHEEPLPWVQQLLESFNELHTKFARHQRWVIQENHKRAIAVYELKQTLLKHCHPDIDPHAVEALKRVRITDLERVARLFDRVVALEHASAPSGEAVDDDLICANPSCGHRYGDHDSTGCCACEHCEAFTPAPPEPADPVCECGQLIGSPMCDCPKSTVAPCDMCGSPSPLRLVSGQWVCKGCGYLNSVHDIAPDPVARLVEAVDDLLDKGVDGFGWDRQAVEVTTWTVVNLKEARAALKASS